MEKLITPRTDHSQSTLLDGRVFVCGGWSLEYGQNLRGCELHTLGGKRVLACYMSKPRRHHTQSTLFDGRVLVCGGLSGLGASSLSPLQDTLFFDPRNEKWTPGPLMLTTRMHHSQSVLMDGRVLVCGGITQDVEHIHFKTEIYNPTTNTWSPAARMIAKHANHSQSTLQDGRVLVCAHNGCEIYDPDRNTWTQSPSMIVPRKGHAQTTLCDGCVLVTGGCVPHKSCQVLSSCELFNPITNTWTMAVPMPTGKQGHGQSLLLDGRILVSGLTIEILSGNIEWPTRPLLQLPPVPNIETIPSSKKRETLHKWITQSRELIAKDEEYIREARIQIEKEYQEAVDVATKKRSSELDQCRRNETAHRLVENVCAQLATLQDEDDSSAAAPPRDRPDDHYCSITTEVMRDPVMIECGDTFERSAIEAWFENNDTCPLCRDLCKEKKTTPNRIAKRMIEDWLAPF